ncbi:MAG: site-specific DNA-methyltransferase [Clostridiales bacterium]
MATQRIKHGFLFDEQRREKLKQIAPECFSDDNINWQVLREALGEYVDDEADEFEHFGMFWPGKKQARRIASIPSTGALVPLIKKGVNVDSTKNVFIEGENLEVLKLLQKSYAGRIKMIYIDPPYNTGKDFVYEDNFSEPLNEYLRRTGQLDEKGNAISSNTKADGRFHSKWLSMIYPRLRLARNLLRDDGVIFISIDDNEAYHLRTILNEIFGEENFLAQLIWKSGRTSSGHYTTEHEYIIGFCKTKEGFKYFDFHGEEIISDRAIKRPSVKNPVSDIEFPAGLDFLCEDKVFPRKFGGEEPVEVVNGTFEAFDGKLRNKVVLRAAWTMKDMILDWLKGKEVIDQKGQIVEKFFFKSNGVLQYQKKKGTLHPKTIIDGISTKTGTNEVVNLFGKKVFSFPKPSQLLLDLMTPVLSTSGGICLDFFAGSGTFGDALLQFSEKNPDCEVNFVIVQMPEPINSDDDDGKVAISLGYKNIAEICADRLRKRIKQINKPALHLGFKYYSLSKSTFKAWDNYDNTNIKELENLFESHTFPLVDGWDCNTLLTEILLIEGFPLDSKVEIVNSITKNTVYRITSSYHEHKLIVCLDEKIKNSTIECLALAEDDIFICTDNAVTDQQKLELDDKGLIKTI